MQRCLDNGQHLGTRPYGFTTFYYDLTPHLYFGSEPNLVAVRVDNSHQPNLRWYSGSGINRHTWLINTGPVYIEQWGTGVTTLQITAQTATVEVSTRVRNELAQSASCTLRTQVLDQSGAVVQSLETIADIPAGGDHLFVQRIVVPQPNSGRTLRQLSTPHIKRCATTMQMLTPQALPLAFVPSSSMRTRGFC